ncbi:MAG: hypothetical protein WBK88_07070 [Methanothrix sp.]
MKADRFHIGWFVIRIEPHMIDVSTNEDALPRYFHEAPHRISYNGIAATEEEAIEDVRRYFRVLREEGMIDEHP